MNTQPLHKPVVVHLPLDVIETVKSRVLFGKHCSVNSYLSQLITAMVRRKHIRTRPKNGGK